MERDDSAAHASIPKPRELADVNHTLLREISEHVETEESLRASEHDLATSRQELRDLAARLLTVQEEERRRISRDLHDDINQRLAMLVQQMSYEWGRHGIRVNCVSPGLTVSR